MRIIKTFHRTASHQYLIRDQNIDRLSHETLSHTPHYVMIPTIDRSSSSRACLLYEVASGKASNSKGSMSRMSRSFECRRILRRFAARTMVVMYVLISDTTDGSFEVEAKSSSASLSKTVISCLPLPLRRLFETALQRLLRQMLQVERRNRRRHGDFFQQRTKVCGWTALSVLAVNLASCHHARGGIDKTLLQSVDG